MSDETAEKDKKEETPVKDENIKDASSRDSNKISSEDFENIDSKFTKKESIVDKILHKNKKDENEDVQKKKEDTVSQKNDTDKRIDDLLFRVDKQEGKLEAESGFREALNERISTLTEEIGELRSMILDRERAFNEIQTGFETIQDATREIQPKKIDSKFDKMEKMIIDNTVKSEKTELFMNTIKDEITKYRIQMSKIKSFDNLLLEIDKLKEKIDQINDSKNYVDRKAAKVETIFGDLNDRLKEFNKDKATLEKVDEISQELLKNMDKLEIKLEEGVLKEDLEKKIMPIDNSIKDISKKITDATNTISVIETKTQKCDIAEIETIQKEIIGLEHIIDSLQEQVVTHKNNMDTIKNNNPKSDERLIKNEQNILNEINKITVVDSKIDANLIKLSNEISQIQKNTSNLNEEFNQKLKEQEDIYLNKRDLVNSTQVTHKSHAETINYLKKDISIQPPNTHKIIEKKIIVNTHTNKDKTTMKKEPNTKKQKVARIKINKKLSYSEKEIISQLIVAQKALEQYAMNDAEKSYKYICALLNPLIEDEKTENVMNLFDTSQELYKVLSNPTETHEIFNQKVNSITKDLYEYQKKTKL